MELRINNKRKLKKQHWIAIIASSSMVFISFLLFKFAGFISKDLFYFIFGLSLVITGLPFFASLLFESKQERNKEEMFLEFSRDLVEGVKSGTSIGKSIVNIRGKDYGSLNPFVDKLANQIGIGIPVREAFNNFSKDVNSSVISRALTLIEEAERAGGKIETILESVASSVGQIEKLRKERRAAIYTLTVQGYIVFFIFIVIMLVLQFKIIPMVTEIGSSEGFGAQDTFGAEGFSFSSNNQLNPDDMATAFMFLLIVQGFFAGLVLGKISEGNVKAGFKHSFILVTLALIISTGARAFLGS